MPVPFPEIPDTTGCLLSIGNFDGVHLGHQKIIRELVSQAHQRQVPGCVLTFEPHPIRLLRPAAAPPRLTTVRQKESLLTDLGVTHVVTCPTSRQLLELTAEQFFREIVVDRFQAVGLVEGPNFFFGKNRGGSIETLDHLCRSHGLSLTVIEPSQHSGTMISSSAIRDALAAGEIELANQFLGRSYSVSGVVESGAGRGRQLGFPTANLSRIETMLPGDGVYAATAIVREESDHSATSSAGLPAAVNIGSNPTFQDANRKVEAHLLDCSLDLYGRSLTLRFHQRLRGVLTFDSVESLTRQIQADLSAVRNYFNTHHS